MRAPWRRPPTLRPFIRGRTTAPAPGAVVVTADVDAEGRAVALWSDAAGARLLSGDLDDSPAGDAPEWTSAALAEPVPGWVTIRSPDSPVRVVELQGLRLLGPEVQTLPGDELLVVGARCEWTPDGGERNAAVYGPDGRVRRTGVVGDDVQQLRVTRAGEVWVGYGDEGVYGNLGWDGARGPEPIGRHGLNRFDRDLELRWEFPVTGDEEVGYSPEGDAVIRVAGTDNVLPWLEGSPWCEVLTVDGDDLWAAYSTTDGYPLVRVSGGRLRAWRNTTPGLVAAVVVAGRTVGLVAPPRHGRATVVLGHLAGDVFVADGEVRVLLPGDAAGARTRLQGLGDTLHVLTPSGGWLTVDLGDLTAAL